MKAYVSPALLSAVQQNLRGSFDVIVQGDQHTRSTAFFKKAFADSASRGQRIEGSQLRRQFLAVDGGRMTLTGWQILALSYSGSVKSIVANEAVQQTGTVLPVWNTQKQLWAANAPVDWTSSALSTKLPTIAIVDSGVDASRSDFGGRVLGQINLSSSAKNSAGDGFGHGTFVAGVAAGSAAGHAGVAPNANLLSLDVMGDDGSSTVADVLAACDWILQNHAAYNIKVANFSLHAASPASVFFDPLDQAVEKLWLAGVTVVAASGNYAVDGAPSGVPFAPGNDPFVITVGAQDINGTLDPSDDVAAPWSAWGYSLDGFAKPDLGAPGRYIIGAASATGGLALERPDAVLGNGYMQLSGTSFAAPAVAGAAAELLARHPDWTPDQVKGALMVSANALPSAKQGSLGVGGLNVAAALRVSTPPNPNAALDKYVVSAGDGMKMFDATHWQKAAQSSAAWSDAAWSDAAWASAAWSDAAWASAAWSDAAWASAAWSDAAWSDAAWSDAAWSDAAWSDAAEDDDAPQAFAIPQADQSSVLSALGLG
jgi:serine protease AprX